MLEQPSLSKLQFYSLGIVSANKPLKSNIIEVTPIEDFPMLNGEITDNIMKYTSTTVDSGGTTKNTEIDTTASVRATWLPISNSNRRTSPDVRRGETVVIYKFADTDKYWWNTIFNDSTLRRLETVIYAFSDNRNENVEDTATSTYFFEVSTHKKLIHLHTSKSDNEPFAYDVQINAKDGIITITDDVDNVFILNSRDTRITMQNADGSVVDIDRKNIKLKCDETISLECKDLISRAANTSLIESGSSLAVKSGSNEVTGPTTFKDPVSFNSGFSSSNGGGGSASFTGDVSVDGNLAATVSVTAPNIR